MQALPQDQRVELRRLDIMSLARFLAVFHGLLMLVSAMLSAFLSDYASEGRAMTLLPAMIQITLNALSGFVMGLIFGFVYNAVATAVGLRLTVRRVAVPEEEEEAAAAGLPGAPAPRTWPGPAPEALVDRRAARQQEKAAFVKAAVGGLLVVAALGWMVLLMPMEGIYRECKDFSGEGTQSAVSAPFRCLQTATRARAYGFLFPVKNKRIKLWAREAELRLAQNLSQAGYPLAAAAYASRYLRHPVDEKGSQQAQQLVDYAKWKGFSAGEIAAADNLRATLKRFHCKDTLGDSELYFIYELKNGNRQRLQPATCAWVIGQIGKQEYLPVKELAPGQAITDKVSFSLPKGVGNFGSKDIMILPVRACPAQ